MRWKLDKDDFRRLLGCEGPLPRACAEAIDSFDFSFDGLSNAVRDQVILRVLRTLDGRLEAAGSHRLPRWEEGWSENLREFRESGYDTDKLIPKFVKRSQIVRLMGDYVQPVAADFETNFVRVLRSYLFSAYFSEVESVYEFGCGTGHNLVDLAKLYPQKKLFGYDWSSASVAIIDLLRSEKGYNIRGGRFDLFSPDASVKIDKGAGVFTVGTLEQTGERFVTFLEWLLRQPFSVCVNVETLLELYDPETLMDHLAARYVEKRGYLRGYLSALRALEERGRIKIRTVKRTFGSLFHDGYSFVVWQRA